MTPDDEWAKLIRRIEQAEWRITQVKRIQSKLPNWWHRLFSKGEK